jgi:DNA replication and repair protein RecF
VRLKRLRLSHFRNIANVDFEPTDALNFFVGDNAQGKTSLIEGIFFLSTLRSFRTTKTVDLIQTGEPAFQLEANVDTKSAFPQKNPQTLDLKIRAGTVERKVWLNGKATTASKFAGRLKVVVFSPESLSAIKSGPEARRELVDTAVFQISEQGAVAQAQFARALRQRNAALKQIRDGQISPQKGRQVIESLDLGFVNLAAEVTTERLKLLDEIFVLQQEVLSSILGHKIDLKFTYPSGGREWTQRGLDQVRARLIAELDDPTRRATEEALGVTLTGPHRHDLAFLFNGNDSRIFCSQGQQRALILAFKIAEIVYHSKVFASHPLLLLDDVLSEFDEQKRRFLIDFLRKHDAQTFLTTTDSTQALQGCSICRVTAGRIENEGA